MSQKDIVNIFHQSPEDPQGTLGESPLAHNVEVGALIDLTTKLEGQFPVHAEAIATVALLKALSNE